MADKVEIILNPRYYKGKTSVIETHNNNKNSPNVKRVKHSGKEMSGSFLPFSVVTNSGKLFLRMSET